MADKSATNTDAASSELARVAEQLSARLHARGVTVLSADSPDELGSLLEAVEAFETSVEANGGDLMVDEAPAGKKTEPDNEKFVLPSRKANEGVAQYIARIASATTNMRR